MAKCSIADNINFWKDHENTKDKNFIDFSKNSEIKEKFISLMKTIKKRSE